MMPAYKCMDSHPYQRNQMAYPHYCQPGMEAIPPQMNMDLPKSPFVYEQPWPYAGSYGYPTPMQFCCGHHQFPGYCSYRPAYPHIPSSSPMCFSGGCPANADHFYAPYVPPHYTMELPRYEYDKCMPKEYHCCGCPNYPTNHKEGRSVKIEEHEPDIEKKVNNVVAPIQLKNYPYPFVWIPPEYTSDREMKKPVVSEVGDQDRISHGRKPLQDVGVDRQAPKVWNGWFPLDINSLSNMIQDGNGRRNQNWQINNTNRESEDGRKIQNQQGENNRREFPFPIIWMPNYNMQDAGRTNTQESASTPNSIQEAPHAFKCPTSSCAEDDVSNRTNLNRNNLKTEGSDVIREVKSEGGTPVKQMELHQGKKDSESSDRRVRNIPVKQTERDMTNKESRTSMESNDKESQTSVKGQSTSPQKTSKLPPVCLRVDPLPKKKNGSGSSRSPSPPASKEVRPKEKSIKAVEKSSEKKDVDVNDEPLNHDKAQADLKIQNASNVSKEVMPKEGSFKVLEKYNEKKNEDQGDGSQSEITSNLTNVEENRIKEKEAEVNISSVKEEEATVARGARDLTKLADDKPTKDRKVLSTVEAAILIQAAYRGFQVRKGELLKKLKQIAEVSKHVADVKRSIQTLEMSSDLQNDERQRVTIGETIMRLLLKLDTIQGLHPSCREMRKSLARELTSLQERLDSIMVKNSQLQMERLSAGKPVDDTPVVAPNREYMQEQPKEKVLEHGIQASSEGSIRESHDMLDLCQDQLSMREGNPSSPVDDGKYETGSPVDPAVNEEIKSSPNGIVTEDYSHMSIDAFSGSGISEFEMVAQNKAKAESVEVDDLDMKAWRELPQGILDEEESVDDIRKNNHNETASEEPQLSGVSTLPMDKYYPIVTNDCAKDGASSEINEVAELPVGLLDDDTTSEIVLHDDAEVSKEVLQGNEKECKATVGTTSSEDDISTGNQLDEQQPEEETQSTEESDGWVKLELQKDDVKGEALFDAEVRNLSREENEQQSVAAQFTGNDLYDVIDENVCLGAEEVPVAETPEEQIKKEEELEVKEVPIAETPKEIKEGEALEAKGEVKEALFESGNIISEEAVDVDAVDADKREASAVQKSEQSIRSPVSKEVSIPERDRKKDDDKNFIEENEKLRQMMQKLLEAGNEQLTVISNLTGRVRDLEKKLARKRRVRTKHCRPTTSKPSCKKSSNNPLQGRAVGVM